MDFSPGKVGKQYGTHEGHKAPITRTVSTAAIN